MPRTEVNSVPDLMDQRAAREARTCQRMDTKRYHDTILSRIRASMDDARHPLGEVVQHLVYTAPIRDLPDLYAYLEVRDGRALGKALLALIATVSLETYQDADEGF